MLLRFILLLAITGGLTVFTVQNLTPLLPLVFFGIRFPALPLAWWVLGAIAAGAASMLVIQVLFRLSNFVTGQSVRARVRATATRTEGNNRWSSTVSEPDVRQSGRSNPRRDRSPASDDSTWQDWRGYEPAQPPPRSPSPPNPDPVDDWERPINDDWESPSPQTNAHSQTKERISPEDLKNFETNSSHRRGTQTGSTYSYSYREPEDAKVNRTEPVTEPVVDADYRVIVPPHRSLDDMIPPPPPPPVEENADDWFEDSSNEFGEPGPGTTSTRQQQ